MRLVLFLLVLSTSLFGQKHDYVWLFGYDFNDNPSDSLWGTSVMDFNESPPRIYYDGNKTMDFDGNTNSISDSEGNFLFSSNGNWLENFNNQGIEGDDFNTGRILLSSGASYVIPINGRKKFGHFHNAIGWTITVCGKEWWYSEIDMNENDGLGKVKSQEIIFSDTLETAKIAGTRHANGKDWWFLGKEFNSNLFYKILFNEGHFEITDQIVGDSTTSGFGQTCFSPDGSKYANASAISVNEGMYLDLYDFDRCNGEISNHIKGHYDVSGFSGGVAFSPNSRFLYLSSADKLFQYDTWEDDVLDSEVVVAEYDGFIDSVDTGSSIFLTATDFLWMQLAPNNKIYITTTNGSHYLHVIENPNEKGLACNVRQHAIRLPTPNTSIPNFPNYRLGALEGSPCDTLLSSNADLEISNWIEVFPNPTNGNIQIEWASPLSSAVSFSVLDVSGKLVFEKRFLPQGVQENIELIDIPNGIYIYQLRMEGQLLKTDKLVIVE